MAKYHDPVTKKTVEAANLKEAKKAAGKQTRKRKPKAEAKDDRE